MHAYLLRDKLICFVYSQYWLFAILFLLNFMQGELRALGSYHIKWEFLCYEIFMLVPMGLKTLIRCGTPSFILCSWSNVDQGFEDFGPSKKVQLRCNQGSHVPLKKSYKFTRQTKTIQLSTILRRVERIPNNLHSKRGQFSSWMSVLVQFSQPWTLSRAKCVLSQMVLRQLVFISTSQKREHQYYIR